MDRLLQIFTALSIGLMLVVLRSVRREHIRVEYSVSWLGAALLLFALSLMPAALARLAQWFGLTQSSEALLLIALFVFIAVFYRFSLVISALKDNNIALAQRVAILEYHIRQQHEEAKDSAITPS
jgi:hypothetical protein